MVGFFLFLIVAAAAVYFYVFHVKKVRDDLEPDAVEATTPLDVAAYKAAQKARAEDEQFK